MNMSQQLTDKKKENNNGSIVLLIIFFFLQFSPYPCIIFSIKESQLINSFFENLPGEEYRKN